MSLLKLQAMIDSGKTYYYRGKPTVFKSFDNSRDEIEIMVEIEGNPQQFIKESEEKLDLFLPLFTEVPVVQNGIDIHGNKLQEQHKHQGPALYAETKDVFSSLTEKLMADIDKVRENPEYINQAKQVCNNVNSIVNITRLQLQLVQKG